MCKCPARELLLPAYAVAERLELELHVRFKKLVIALCVSFFVHLLSFFVIDLLFIASLLSFFSRGNFLFSSFFRPYFCSFCSPPAFLFFFHLLYYSTTHNFLFRYLGNLCCCFFSLEATFLQISPPFCFLFSSRPLFHLVTHELLFFFLVYLGILFLFSFFFNLQATERQASTPNPPPETFSPFSSKKGSDKTAADPVLLAAAAERAAEALEKAEPKQVGQGNPCVPG